MRTEYLTNITTWDVLCILFLAFVAWLIRTISKRERKDIAEWRERETKELSDLKATSEDIRHYLNGSNATTLQYKELECRIDGRLVGLEVKRILMNEHREYFFWLWHSSRKHFIKNISHTNAKAILKEKYIKSAD
jgi:hypothetical protein